MTEQTNGAAANEDEGTEAAWACHENGGILAVFGRGKVGTRAAEVAGVPTLVVWHRDHIADPDSDDAPMRAVESGKCILFVFESVEGVMAMMKRLAVLAATFVPEGEVRDKAMELVARMQETIEEVAADAAKRVGE